MSLGSQASPGDHRRAAAAATSRANDSAQLRFLDFRPRQQLMERAHAPRACPPCACASYSRLLATVRPVQALHRLLEDTEIPCPIFCSRRVSGLDESRPPYITRFSGATCVLGSRPRSTPRDALRCRLAHERTVLLRGMSKEMPSTARNGSDLRSMLNGVDVRSKRGFVWRALVALILVWDQRVTPPSGGGETVT